MEINKGDNDIKLVILDFDGVFTDGKFYFNNTNVSKCYHAKDAYSLKLLKKADIKCGIITGDKHVSLKDAPHIFNRLDKCSIGEDRPKIDILNEWLQDFNYSYKNVAYIGDDLPDIEVLKTVSFSACPKDAIQEVKNVCNMICSNKSGEGAVREFIEEILKKHDKSKHDEQVQHANDGKITVVIPVRKGSQRCKEKNIRNFSDTNLLQLKIEILKRCTDIDEIIVSSDCDEMLQIATRLGVNIHKRDSYYASNDCPNHEYWCYLARTVGIYSNLMMVNCVSPLINDDIINSFIKKFKSNNYNNMVTVREYKKFTLDSCTENPINFNWNKAPNSQCIGSLSEITFGISIATRENIIENKAIYGLNPVLYKLDDINSIDIDNNHEFIISELLFDNHIINTPIAKLIMERRINKVELLDCSLRDGGYLNNWNFTNDQVIDCYKSVTHANYDYFEIGFRSNIKMLKGKGKWCYSSEEDINLITNRFEGCKIAVMAKIGTVSINDFIDKTNSKIHMVRVLLARTSSDGSYISTFDKNGLLDAKDFCQKLLDYGYEVTLNLGCGDLISDTEIVDIIYIFHDVNIKCLYLADTYGGFNCKNIQIQLHKFYTELNKYDCKLPVGVHIHNNNGDGLEKAKISLFHGATMLDTSIGGYARGAGNLKSEEYICYQFRNDPDELRKRMIPLVDYYDKYILSKKEYISKNILHHPYYNIAGSLSLHPDYILEILSNSDQTVQNDINLIFDLSDHTIKTNRRHYDNKLITELSNK